MAYTGKDGDSWGQGDAPRHLFSLNARFLPLLCGINLYGIGTHSEAAWKTMQILNRWLS